MKRWATGLLAGLIIVVAGGAGYLGVQSRDEPESETLAVPQTVLVTRGNVQQTVTAPGELVRTGQTVIGFDIAGKLDMLDLRPGDHVRSGQILARLDMASLERALEEARLKLSRADAEHARQLADAELVLQSAQLRLEQAQMDHARQIAETEQVLRTARARLVQAQLQYPNLTPAEILLNQATADEAYTHDEYRKALDRPWEPQTVRDGALRAWNAARDALAIAQAGIGLRSTTRRPRIRARPAFRWPLAWLF